MNVTKGAAYSQMNNSWLKNEEEKPPMTVEVVCGFKVVEIWGHMAINEAHKNKKH